MRKQQSLEKIRWTKRQCRSCGQYEIATPTQTSTKEVAHDRLCHMLRLNQLLKEYCNSYFDIAINLLLNFANCCKIVKSVWVVVCV